jgi:polysaccharide export outer membrane protein
MRSPAAGRALAALTFSVFLSSTLAAGTASADDAATQPAAPQPTAPEYRLQPGDTIDVAVWKEPELQKLIVVRPDGKFSFPLAGEVNATNRTVSQVQKEIETRLKAFIPEPVVTVSVTEIGGNRIYVIGQVNKPGAYIMNPQLNVLQALSLAGGTTPFASLNDIRVMRASSEEKRAMKFDYGDVSRGRNLEQNVMLEAGDVVIVP